MGKARREGRSSRGTPDTYVMADGDVVEFRFNV
jgi:ribosome-binding ATPase YchF (GTP1/OBG family)